MTRPFTIDLDSPDYRPAVTALEWAFVNAQRLKFTLPTGFEMALQLLKDEAKVIMLLSSPKGGFMSLVEAGENAQEEDFDDFLDLMKKRGERKREKRKLEEEAAEAVAAFARGITVQPEGREPGSEGMRP
jgi:phenolic acid decarboxylase